MYMQYRHFRPAKGWKREFQELSLVFVLVIATTLSVAVPRASAGTDGVWLWGRLLPPMLPCNTTPANPCLPYGLAENGAFIFALDGPPLFVGISVSSIPLCGPALPGMRIIGMGTIAGLYFRPVWYCAVPG